MAAVYQVRRFAAAFGRLCVETIHLVTVLDNIQAAAFGRLCVETYSTMTMLLSSTSSRLRAAVC